MSLREKPVIGIIGAGKCSKKMKEQAYLAGKTVTKMGGIVVCGGLGGIMEGAAQGARENGGIAIGIVPGEDKKEANEFVDVVIPSGFGEARNILVVRTADAIIAFPGKYGTLTEMAFALQAGKPLVSISAWNIDDKIIPEKDPKKAVKKVMEILKETK